MADVRFNPFSWRLELDQMALDTPDGKSAVTAEHAVVDIDMVASLKSRCLIVEGTADRSSIRIELDAKGMSNWTKLIAETGETLSPKVPIMVRVFSIKNSTLDFMDEGGKVTLSASEVNADLYDLGPDLSRPARLELKSSGGGQAKLDGTAVLTLVPVQIHADLHVENLDLMAVSAYLQGIGIVLQKGSMKGNLAFEYKSTGDGPVFFLGKSNLTWHDVKWRAENGPSADNKVDEIRLDELEYDGAKSMATLAKAHINSLSIPGPLGLHVRLGNVDIGKLSVGFSKFSAQAGSVVIHNVTLTQERGAGRTEAVVSNIRLNGLGWNENVLSAKAFGLDGIKLQDSSATSGLPRDIRFGKISAEELRADFGERFLSVAKFDSADAEISAWLAANEGLEMPGFIGAGPAGIGTGSTNESWAFSLEEGLIRNYRLSLADHGADPPAAIVLDGLEIHLQGVDSRRGKFTLRLESCVDRRGRITAQGSGSFDPPEADLRLQMEDVSLRPFRSYLDGFARIDLAKGRLNLKGDLAYRPMRNDVRFSGMAEIAGLVTLDKKEGRDFIHWRSLRAEGLTLETAANRLSIRELIADKPYARIVVSRERTLNVIENLFQPRSKAATPPGQVSRPLAVTVGSLLVRDGSADFSDLSLQPSVSVDIHDLTGVIRSLSSSPDAKAEVSIKGSISDASPVTVSGRINPFRIGTFADLSMRFTNVDLTELSPYSARFAGYRIDKGKADLDLHYRLSDRKLLAENNMVFDHLTLGERVDSPEATSLPVKLAISLMRGLDGKIHIDLPISGNLDDPRFSITGLLAKAAMGVIAQVVRSPFSAIGVLFDGGSDDAGAIGFRPGSFELDGVEKSKLDRLATALSERPGLSLEIRGTARSGRDASALAEQQLRRQLENATAIELRPVSADGGPAGSPALSDGDYRRLFSHFYRLRYPDAAEWAELPKGERVLAGTLFASAWGKALKDSSVSEFELRRLAQARAAGIRSYLMQKGIEPNRIYLLDVELNPGDGDAVALLSLS
ncbi:DUF748 domain-containing protein [Methylococcus capsulatus]|nr:DUF748 domain-containing protein [Methylococcus capsulatus]